MKFDNSNIRRKDRLLNEEGAVTLLNSGEYGVLSMVDMDGKPYAIPINYVFDGNYSIYLHCAPQGHKLNALSRCTDVVFVVVGHTHVLSDKFTTEYESVVVRGTAQTGLEPEERRNALRLLLEKYSPDDVKIGMVYAEKSFSRTEIIRIDIHEFSAKSKRVLNR